MMTICTEEDLLLLRKEFNETVKMLRSEINELRCQLGLSDVKSNKDIRPSATLTHSFGSVEALEEYVDKVILSAQIPNLDKAELEMFKNRKTTYYIRDMIDKCASAEDKTYLLSAPVGKGLKRVDTWVKDPRFTEIVYYCLPKYRDGYLKERYQNISKLRSMQARMKDANTTRIASAAISHAEEVLEGKVNRSEFKKRVDRAIGTVKSSPEYQRDWRCLGRLIKSSMDQFSKEEKEACNYEYYRQHNTKPKSNFASIGYVPECAFKFIESFEKAVYNNY